MMVHDSFHAVTEVTGAMYPYVVAPSWLGGHWSVAARQRPA